ncbi:hypothetical protein RJZ56_005601 [Blastomyces dermatitidis]|uniref:Presequence translocated-associated motor subunit PAM17 n=3 Tax=Blastomyces TaxID=229219 RepID=A0A179UL66_BLAGS|nr:presequence translocated-associated motor subunit pam17 [Blastomyces gilchristii SLH14081]XP_045274267.1 presequence translocated-associated motor subunit pam17 [Blastomyces dermatitidis ER-3]EEQ86802.1 presequence translocated-associated motor subunit pam17 [Blastomyces dermatitidis ER-3]EGE85990.1 presequence translocated-associated motor subunit pam17 [Blastomyces dermatitidis ATCC 18188]OAT07978.1 presequence translocated-associated motor subunit pam17 [Blastomyces gilchristii SLH14081]
MHLTVINGPFRTAVLGSRIPCSLSPFILSNTSNTTNTTGASSSSSSFPALHQQCKYSTARSPRAQLQQQQKRHASTRCSGQSLFKFQQNPISRIPDRSTSALNPNSAAANTTTSLRATTTRKSSTQAPSSSSGSSASSSSAHSSTSPYDLPLDWNSFFRLRASRRKYSLVSSIIASVFSTAGGVQVLAANNMDTIGAQALGLDPFIVLGLATASCAALGWLLGPILGNSLWGLVHRKYKASVAVKEKEFYSRIKRFRVDPSANSYSNPVPDYYGEKIGSIQGYRQWLKDQRAFNRKKRNFL